MNNIEERRKIYSVILFVLAGVHLVYTVLFANAKCKQLIFFNIVLLIMFFILGMVTRKAQYLMGIFSTSCVALVLNAIVHMIFLGPTYGFQYIFFSTVPLIFYVSYVGERKLKFTLAETGIVFILFALTTIISSFIKYPLLRVPKNINTAIGSINLVLNFCLSVIYMILYMAKATAATGLLRDQNDDLEQSANIDTLTGLRNRRSIEEYMNKTLIGARGEGKDFSILMCDIDNFKHVNDTYGHDCGDEVLKNIANVIKNELRQDDVVFRWGGEEILIVVASGNYVAKKVAERCRAAVEASEVVYRGTTVKVTITIGGTSYYQGVTYDELVKRADNNLYTGKHNGKNQVVM